MTPDAQMRYLGIDLKHRVKKYPKSDSNHYKHYINFALIDELNLGERVLLIKEIKYSNTGYDKDLRWDADEIMKSRT